MALRPFYFLMSHRDQSPTRGHHEEHVYRHFDDPSGCDCKTFLKIGLGRHEAQNHAGLLKRISFDSIAVKRLGRWVGVLVAVVAVGVLGRMTFSVSRVSTPAVVNVLGLQVPLRHDQLWPEKTFLSSDLLGLTPSLNSTLGFERIYVLNMPSRRDKKAELTVCAFEYGLNLTFVDAVNGIAARPDLKDDRHRQGLYGVAEGHAGVWRQMLREGVSTALILEDDVDFHVAIKDQLLRLQEPLAMLTSIIDGKPAYRDPHDPYNSAHWDQLWLGEETEHAWSLSILANNITQLPYAVFRDPTRSTLLTDVEHEREYVDMMNAYGVPLHLDDKEADKRVRVLQPSVEPFALSGYALTVRGAKMALYKNAHKGWIDHIDFDLKEMSREGLTRDYTLVPPIFQQRKPLQGEDSDRSGIADSGHLIAGKAGRTATMRKTARETLAEALLSHDKPAFKPGFVG